MSEHPTNTYSPEHPGHTEPDRYLDDDGRCTFCGRSVAEATMADLERELGEAREAIEKGGVVMFTGLSVPKRDLDNAKAEHAHDMAEAQAQLRANEAAQAEMRAALKGWRQLRAKMIDCSDCTTQPFCESHYGWAGLIFTEMANALSSPSAGLCKTCRGKRKAFGTCEHNVFPHPCYLQGPCPDCAPSTGIRCVDCKGPLTGAYYGAGTGDGQRFRCGRCHKATGLYEALVPLLRRLRAAHESIGYACSVCHVPWPCQDVVDVRAAIKDYEGGHA